MLSRPGSKLADVKAIAESLEIPTLTDGYMNTLEDSLKPYPKPYKPEDSTHFPTVKWLKEHKIRDIWKKTEGVKQAYYILERPYVREIVEASIVSPLPQVEFLDDLPNNIDIKGIKTYQHYFFNITLVDMAQLQEILDRRGGLRKIAFNGDVEPELARGIFRYFTGRSNFTLPMGQISKKIMDIAAIKVLQLARTRPSKNDALMTQMYTSSIKQGQDILANSGAAAEDLIDLFGKLAVGANKGIKISTYKQLTGRERTHGKSDGGGDEKGTG